MENTPSFPRLFALLIGINDYQAPVPRLRGCVPDIERIAEYLQKEEVKNFNLHIEILKNKAATRDQTIALFKNHLARANANDTVLFYYSGHGAQEAADPSIWRFEPDNKLEGLVLYDSVPTNLKDAKLLADKEIRHLLHHVASRTEANEPKAGSPHIVVITDCCHSGENTRGDLIESAPNILPRIFTPKNDSGVLPMRPWESFCFSGEISPEALKTIAIDEVIPQADHISLSACQSFEKAFEVDGSGILTDNLLEILKRSQGTVSYHDLRSRIRNYIKGMYPQAPQIYASGDKRAIYKSFLGRNAGSKALHANVQYNDKAGWMMDMGAIHGVSNQVAKGISILDEKEQVAFEAEIKLVHMEFTQLVFAGDKKPSIGKEYKGLIKHFLSAPINIYLNNQGADPNAESQLRALLEKNGQNIHLAHAESQADYTVQMQFGYYAITKPGDPYRPLVLPAKTDVTGAQLCYMYLQHISQFDYIKNLENTAGNTLNPDTVQFELFQQMPDGADQPIAIQNEKGREVIDLEYTGTRMNFGKARPSGLIKIKLTNMDSGPLYVALVYLSNDFQAYTGFINGVQRLEKPGSFIWAQDGKALPLSYEDHVHILNLPSSDVDLKLIISRKQFDVNPFDTNALPTFDKLVYPDRGETSRGLGIEDSSTDQADAWTTRLVGLRIKNPNYNRISKQELENWMGSDGGPFVKGIYLEAPQV